MGKVAVVFWSGTGNTEVMANTIVDSVKKAGSEVDLFNAVDFSADLIDTYDRVAFGCPSMGAEVLEEDEFVPMFNIISGKLLGKEIALFGSYGWGDGEWMRDWEADCLSKGALMVCDPIICVETPDAEAMKALVAMGEALARAL